MMNKPAVLFDLDGTLLDTAPEFTFCLNELLTQEGKAPVTVASLRSSVSFGAKGMLSFGFKLSRQDPQLEHLLPRFLALYENKIGQLTALFPGMEQLLGRLGDEEIPWGIVTNKPLCFAKPLVHYFKPLQATKCLIAGDSLPEQKPSPAPLLHAAALLQVAPDNCWYIGDAKSDLEASRKAKMRCAIANYGYIPADEDAYSWEADGYLEKPQDIEKFLFA